MKPAQGGLRELWIYIVYRRSIESDPIDSSILAEVATAAVLDQPNLRRWRMLQIVAAEAKSKTWYLL